MKWIDRFELRPGKWVHVPSKKSRSFGKDLIADLKKHYAPPKYFYHLQKGGHVEALRQHYANSFFCHIDLKDFFEHITSTRVSRALKPYYGSIQALMISRESTVPLTYEGAKKNRLPFGFPQSPLLSSIVLDQSHVGRNLRKLSAAGISVSVYVDDITLSGCDEREIREQYDHLIELCARSRFTVSEEKSHPPKSNAKIFNIEIAHNTMRICPDRMAAFISTYRETKSLAKRGGISNYVHSINPTQVAQL